MLDTRFYNKFKQFSPYKVEKVIIFEKYTKASEAIEDEKFIHILYKEYKYIPKYKFGGYTECFTLQI